jgi:hypothetical protein
MLVTLKDHSVKEIKAGESTLGWHFRSVTLLPEDFRHPDFVRWMTENVRTRIIHPSPDDTLSVGQRSAREALGSAIRAHTQLSQPRSI